MTRLMAPVSPRPQYWREAVMITAMKELLSTRIRSNRLTTTRPVPPVRAKAG